MRTPVAEGKTLYIGRRWRFCPALPQTAFLSLLLSVLFSQRTYLIYRNLVHNGGFEDLTEEIRPCSVKVETPTGSAVRIPYLTLTPSRRWQVEISTYPTADTFFCSTHKLFLPTLTRWPDERQSFHYYYSANYVSPGGCPLVTCMVGEVRPAVGEGRMRAVRGADGSFAYGPLYFLPWPKVAVMADSAGVELWGYALDTAAILRDRSGRMVEFLERKDTRRRYSVYDSSESLTDMAYPPFRRGWMYHPGAGLLMRDWGSPDTLSAAQAYRLSLSPFLRTGETEGLWLGNTRKAFHGIQHIAPGWVAMLGQPRFYGIPENENTFPTSAAGSPSNFLVSYNYSHEREFRRFRWSDLSFFRRSLYHLHEVSDSMPWVGGIEGQGSPFFFHELWGDGYSWWPGGAEAYRYVTLCSPFSWSESPMSYASPRARDWRLSGWGVEYPHSFPYWGGNLLAKIRWNYDVTSPRQLEVLSYSAWDGLVYDRCPIGKRWFWGEAVRWGRRDALYILHRSRGRQHQIWGADLPWVVGPANWIGRQPSLRSHGWPASLQGSIIALGHGAAPRGYGYQFYSFPIHPAGDTIGYPDYEYYWVETVDSVRFGPHIPGRGRWDEFLWLGWGRAYAAITNGGKLYFSPLRSVMGVGMNYPIWHHRRLPEPPRPSPSLPLRCPTEISCVRGQGCGSSAQPAPLPDPWMIRWDTLRMAMRPGDKCAPLPPYRGEGYITLTYPVLEFHGFKDSESYRQFLRGLWQRLRLQRYFNIGWALVGSGRLEGTNGIPYDLLARYPASWIQAYEQLLNRWLDTALSRASIRCGWPVWHTDVRQAFLWEWYMAAQDSYLVRLGENLGIDVGELRRREYEECCGSWWNARTELGGTALYPYEQYKWRPVWKWGPLAWTYPTAGGCPDRPSLPRRHLDDVCLSQSFCAGKCPDLKFGWTPLDSLIFQSKFYWDSLAYYGLDSLSGLLNWTNLLGWWRFRGYGEQPNSWRYWFGLGRYTQFAWLYDSTGPVSGPTAYMRRNPVVGLESNWLRTGEPDLYQRWYWSYRYPDVGCFISLNKGPVETCCPDAPYRVNRAYAIMGYLVDTLKPGKKYKIRMAVAVAPNSKYVINNIGVVVSREPIPNVYPYCKDVYIGEAAISWEYPEFLSKSRWAWWENRTVRLDTTRGWVVLEGELEAKGGEKFIYVGWLDSTRLDTVRIGWSDTVWRNGWWHWCWEQIGLDYPDLRAREAADTMDVRQCRLIEYTESVFGPLNWHLRHWMMGGDASLHIDEVQLIEPLEQVAVGEAEPLRGRVEVWDGVCGRPGRVRVVVEGGTPPYRCFWRRSGERAWIEGCELEVEAGMWEVRVIDANGWEMREFVEVRTTPPVQLSVVRIDSVGPAGGSAVVQVSGGTPPYVVWWEHGAAGETLRVAESGVYVAWVQDSVGCTDRIEVYVPGIQRVWIASAFTPNGDGINDEIAPVALGEVDYYRWQVWDRWGNLLFESRRVGEAWDGRRGSYPVPEGVYAYVLEVRFRGRDRVQVYKGTITVLR